MSTTGRYAGLAAILMLVTLGLAAPASAHPLSTMHGPTDLVVTYNYGPSYGTTYTCSGSGGYEQNIFGDQYSVQYCFAYRTRPSSASGWSDWSARVWQTSGDMNYGAASVIQGNWVGGAQVQFRSQVRCDLQVYSGWYEGAIITVGNTPPTPPTGVAFSPLTASANQDILATGSGATDVDGNPIEYRYKWWRKQLNGVFICDYEGNPLPASHTAPGEVWYCEVFSHDGLSYGTTHLTSPQFTIADAPPTAPTSVTLSPTAPRATDDVTAVAAGSTDPDGYAVTYQVQWSRRAGRFWTLWGLTGATLDKSNLAKGQEWQVRARAYDGTAYSAWYYRPSTFIVANSAPTIPGSVIVSPAAPNEDQDVTATASGSTDVDAADAVQYEYQWYHYAGKREIAGPTGPTLPASSTTPGQVWRAKARAYDGTDYSVWRSSATVTIADAQHAPTAPTIYEFTVGNPVEGDDLTTYVSGSTDADGDTITYQYQWKRSVYGTWGAWQDGTATLAGSAVSGPGDYKFQVRATDGTLNSPWVECAPINVASIIESTVPADNAHGNGRWAGFSVVLSKPMNQAEVESHLHLNAGAGEGPAVPGIVLWTVPQLKFRYKLNAPLAESTQYSVNLDGGIHRADGKVVAGAHGFIFFTNDWPVVTNWQPRYTGVDPHANIVITYDRVMNYASVKSTFTIAPAVEGAWSRSVDQKTYTFNPTADLQAGTEYTVTQGGAVRDANAVHMGTAFQWRFTTTAASPAPVAASLTATAAPSGVVALAVNLSAAAEVQVEVSNLAGRLVARLAPQALPCGISTLTWNGKSMTGSTVPAGTYFAKLLVHSANGTTATALAPLQIR